MVQSAPPAEILQLSPEETQLFERSNVILLLGRSGSGKTRFIQIACADEGEAENCELTERTLDVVSECIIIGPHEYEFIDAPGFVNIAMSNFETFAKLTNYLLQERHTKIAGIIYVHRADDPAESSTVMQNILFDIFLGDSGLSRLTVMVVPNKPGAEAPISAAQALRNVDVFRNAQAKGAKIVPATLCQSDVEQVYMSFVSQPPVLLRIQQEANRDPRRAELVTEKRIRDRLAIYEGNILCSYRKKIRRLESKKDEQEEQIANLYQAYGQVEQKLADNDEETTTVRRQLEQIQKEYAVLRTQLQLHENVEQGEIVQTLKDLNRSIDDLSRAISQRVVDTYVAKVSDEDLCNITTLNSHRLPELKRLLGHTEGRSSLVMSSDGKGMPVEDFLDYGIRSLLCKQLCDKIFTPFHPLVDTVTNNAMATTYNDVQHQEPQTVAARWRARCFKSIHKPLNETSTARHINSITEDFVENILIPVTQCLFGLEAGVKLDHLHTARLQRVFQTAWYWNMTLKGEVIMLGDFCQTNYSSSTRFNSDLMEEFESSRRGSQPSHILATLGLGLTVSHAQGRGQAPNKTVVLKAVVATKRLYT